MRVQGCACTYGMYTCELRHAALSSVLAQVAEPAAAQLRAELGRMSEDAQRQLDEMQRAHQVRRRHKTCLLRTHQGSQPPVFPRVQVASAKACQDLAYARSDLDTSRHTHAHELGCAQARHAEVVRSQQGAQHMLDAARRELEGTGLQRDALQKELETLRAQQAAHTCHSTGGTQRNLGVREEGEVRRLETEALEEALRRAGREAEQMQRGLRDEIAVRRIRLRSLFATSMCRP